MNRAYGRRFGFRLGFHPAMTMLGRPTLFGIVGTQAFLSGLVELP
jgi:hypothetical protein